MLAKILSGSISDEAGAGNKLYVNLNTSSGKLHLSIERRNILRIWQFNQSFQRQAYCLLTLYLIAALVTPYLSV